MTRADALLTYSRAMLAPPAGHQSPFEPGSPFAAAIAWLFGFTLVVCAIIAAVVFGALGYGLYAFRHREGAPEPPQTTGNRTLEVLWTAVPFGIVTLLFVLTVTTMARSDPRADRAPDVTVVGHQWWWEARYDRGLVTANEIHVPTGTPVLVGVESADVIHDFWVPQLGRKMDAVPGHPNRMWIGADTPGSYGGACAEYCGMQHAWMRILVVADAPADYAAWQAAQRSPAARPAGDAAVRGEKLFRDNACGNCHAVRGLGFDGAMAPDLTHLASRATLGAGVNELTPESLAAWMRDPQAIKPGCHMPQFNLSDAQLADLTAFLEGLK